MIVYYSTTSIRSSICFLICLFLRKYVSTLSKQLNSENVLFCRNGHLSTILYICLLLFIYLVQFRKRILNPSRRIFAFYLLGYLSLVITPSVIFYAYLLL